MTPPSRDTKLSMEARNSAYDNYNLVAHFGRVDIG